MIVMDSSFQAKGALQWALSLTVQNQDTIIHLHVTKPHPDQGESSKCFVSPRVNELLQSMKNTCQLKKPEVKVEFQVVDGKEKGPVIVEGAGNHGVAMLVLDQKKKSTTRRLLMTWAGNRVAGKNCVEYCIQNAACMAIAVRRKSKKHGGFLITTKHATKDFWLLD